MSTLLDEYSRVEVPFIAKLKSIGRHHVEGDKDVPYLTHRESFREVRLKSRLTG